MVIRKLVKQVSYSQFTAYRLLLTAYQSPPSLDRFQPFVPELYALPVLPVPRVVAGSLSKDALCFFATDDLGHRSGGVLLDTLEVMNDLPVGEHVT